MRKKIITIASLCVAGMLLCACGTKNNKVETQTQTQQQTESEAATLADGEYTAYFFLLFLFVLGIDLRF